MGRELGFDRSATRALADLAYEGCLNPRETAQRLVALATNAGATHHEAASAAIQACRIIREHKLLGSRAEEAPTPAVVAIVATMLCIRETPDHWVFCLLTATSKTKGSQEFATFPKSVVHAVDWMTEEEKKKVGFKGRLASRLTIDAGFVNRHARS